MKTCDHAEIKIKTCHLAEVKIKTCHLAGIKIKEPHRGTMAFGLKLSFPAGHPR